MGVRANKCPLDRWIYQEILFANRPELIVEIGTALGGSALFMAHMLDIIGSGRVVTVDIKRRDAAAPPRKVPGGLLAF
jgi:cephalosporin hydroxylase